jgi:hypothetical protein
MAYIEMTPDDILRDHSPEVQAIAEALRRLIHDTIENMTERAYPGWHAIGFRHPRAGYVCGIFPLDASIKLVFEHGRQLADPLGVLEGDGKQVRYIVIEDADAIPAEAIRLLLLEAVELKL